ncbi:putative ribonuclease H-like domain-containing protein [Tanacetum coccineum]
MNISTIPTTRIDKDHPKDQIIGDFNSAIQTRRMTKISDEHAMKVIQALEDPSWIEAMQEELLQFQLQKVWTLVNLPNGKRAIRTKWVFRNKKDERGIVVRNKARLMDIKSAFLYSTIEEEVYVCQPPSFEDPQFPDKVYKVEKALYGLHQAPRVWYETLSTYLIENGFRRSTIDKTLFIKKDKGDMLLVQVYVDDIIFGSTKKSLCDEFKVQQKKDGIFISQDKYVADILKKFDFATVKTSSTPMEPNKALIKDEEAASVDVHLYRSMIESLMYLTTSRPDIMFVVCACARDSPFDLEAFSDSDYVGASLDRKSITGGCQCKKQTIVANSTTKAEYVTAANCCGHVLWIQNQMLDYEFNFMNTKIFIDNESTICIVKNPVFHSKTKHIEIRHHFIRDCYEKKLIQVIKIHTDHNVADLLTKAFDVSSTARQKLVLLDVGAEADLNNLETTMNVSPIPTTKIDKDHPKDQIIGDFNSAIQTRRMDQIYYMKLAITQKSNSSSRRCKLDRSNARGASTISTLEVRNKARQVAQGYTQEEGIDYDEVFAPVARIEAIRLFLAYASFMGFIVYQMDIKSTLLYGTIDEEVYVCQPPGFEDPQFLDKVYKVEKALYGLHQAPRAWYETLSTYLIENGFRRGTIDKTLFIKKEKYDILLVQVYVDDIIFGSTKKSLCDEFEGLMHKRFQMSSMGFFLGLQITSTPMEPNKALIKDEVADSVDVYLYRSMIGSLMYLTASRPSIMFVVCACARDSPFDLEAFSNSDYAGACLDRKSTTGGCQFLGKRLISWQCKKQTVVANSTTEVEYVAATNCVDRIRSDLHLEDAGGIDCLPTATIFEELARMGRKQKKTTAVPHPSDSTANVPNEEFVPTHSNDPLLSVKKLEKKAGLRTYKFKRLYKVGVTRRVEYSDDESLGAQKDASNQGRSIEDIDKDAEVSLVDETQGRSDDAEMFDTDALIGNEVFAKNDMIEKDQDVIPKEVSTAAPSTTIVSPPVITEVEITLAQTLAKLKSAKSKVVIQEPVQNVSESTTRTPTSVSSSSIKDKGKAKMDGLEVPLKKKDQIALDEEMARNLEAQIQAELIKEERLARKRKRKPT